MNSGLFAPLITEFSMNWDQHQPRLRVVINNNDIEVDEQHLLYAELFALCCGNSASLPFFLPSVVMWCTVAPNAESLKLAVFDLKSWVIPSFGGTIQDDGYLTPDPSRGGLSATIINVSPDGYYRWRSPRNNIDRILSKLQLYRRLEKERPVRTLPVRPSLYELRSGFSSALLIGDRRGAEEIIEQLDLFQLETATNTQFMRIRMWHRFGELERIRNYPNLPFILSQPLPPRVQSWIDEACGVTIEPTLPAEPSTEIDTEEVVPHLSDSIGSKDTPKLLLTWIEWLDALKGDRISEAVSFIQEQTVEDRLNLSKEGISDLCLCLDQIFLDEPLRQRERGVILSAASELVERYLREPGFPRSALSLFYLSLFRNWCELHKGNSVGQQHGHVLLELASALLKLNENVPEVCKLLEEWWKAKPSPSQLYFALDAIELMESELPNIEYSANLWIEAASVIKRSADALTFADRDLWRRVGVRLGFEENTIEEYLPKENLYENELDLLASAELNHVAIVCLREKQAKQAAEEIELRTGAKVSIVTATEAGPETDLARKSDVVLFVWLASTHAVFRAFDGFNRKRLCYVQGTGSSGIIRALERWMVNHGHDS
jgi:hypothetical protein